MYAPKDPTTITTLDELKDWVSDELGFVSQEFAKTNLVWIDPRGREPDKPRDGMVVYANGTTWDPGDGEGFYVYENGAWKKTPPVPPVPPAPTGEYWVEDFGLKGDNSTNNTPLWAAMMTSLASTDPLGAHIRFRSGVYLFNSQPAQITIPLKMSAVAGPYTKTKIVRNYTPPSSDDYFLWTTAGYFECLDFEFIAATGTSGGVVFQFIQQDIGPFIAGSWAYIAGCRTHGGINMDGSGSWKKFVFANGVNTSSSGVRDLVFHNCWVFDCEGPVHHLLSMQQFCWDQGFWYSKNNVSSIVDGTVGLPSQNIRFWPLIGGCIAIAHTSGIEIIGTFGNDIGPSNIASTVTGYNVDVYDAQDWVLNSFNGTYQNAWYANEVSTKLLQGSAAALANTTITNLTSIVLTAGEWDVYAVVHFQGSAAATVSQIICAIAGTNANLDNDPPLSYNQGVPYTATTNPISLRVGVRRFDVATSQTIYLNAFRNSTGTMTVWYEINARRVVG